MLLLEFHNKIIEDTLLERFGQDKPEPLEAIIADFDGVTFHLSTPDANARNILFISMSIKCFSQLTPHGVQDKLKEYYGAALQTPESGYDVTLKIDTAKAPANKEEFARNVARLKRNVLAAPYYKIFADIEAKKGAQQLISLNYRDGEAVYIKPESDRVLVIFNVAFNDASDVVLSKVFLQEYQDARRTMNNCPAVNFSPKEPPLELKGVSNLRVGDNQGFVTFVLFAPHITGKKKEVTIDNIQTFRNYLHYHMKCSKAYLHTRMRERVRTFLQVLNRAKSAPENVEKKTITGRTFRRADDPPLSDESELND